MSRATGPDRRAAVSSVTVVTADRGRSTRVRR